VPWCWLSLWKWVPGTSPGVKAAGAFGWRPTTLVVPKRQDNPGLNLPGTPWATSACRGKPLLLYKCSHITSFPHTVYFTRFLTDPATYHFHWAIVTNSTVYLTMIQIQNSPCACHEGTGATEAEYPWYRRCAQSTFKLFVPSPAQQLTVKRDTV